jgi:hypothetical protein
MESLLENAQRIFEVAKCAASEERQDFALLIKTDGGLHFVMESPFSIEGAAIHAGALTAYRITRDGDTVRVQGQRACEECLLQARYGHRELLRDSPLYRITSPLLTAGTSPS